VITPAMGPAGHRNHLTDQRLADLAAIMSAHKLELQQGKRAMLRPGTRASKCALALTRENTGCQTPRHTLALTRELTA
jgi:hypothetical protein